MKKNHRHKVAIAVTPYSIERCRILMGIYSFIGGRWDIEMLPDTNLITAQWIDRAAKDGIDGLIASRIESEKVLGRLEESGIKSVVMDTAFDYAPSPRDGISFYDSSAAGAATGAAGFGYLNGCARFRSFAFVANKVPTSWSKNRMLGFVNAASDIGIEASVFSVTGNVRHRLLKKFLMALPKPAAVMSANDWCALETLNCCRSSGIDIPGQMCLLGVDDNEIICSHASPPLSSVRINHEAIGTELARALQRMLGGRRRVPANVLLPEMASAITERDSTKPPVPAAHLIHKGLEYIAAHEAEPITVADIVKHLGVSRRLAELRFSELHGKSISATIKSHRLERARRMLTDTKLGIGHIAAACGFPSRRSAEILFKSRFGMTMGECRQERQRRVL